MSGKIQSDRFVLVKYRCGHVERTSIYPLTRANIMKEETKLCTKCGKTREAERGGIEE